MAATGITIDTETQAGTMEALAAGINARSAALKKVTSDSIVAAAITILRSLKAATKTAPTAKVPAGAYTIERTNLIGCATKKWGGKIGCRVRGSKDISSIRPAVGYTPGEVSPWKCSVYRITPTNSNLKFDKARNAPQKCWYVLCANDAQAKSYAERRILHVLKKESGMAKAALAMAQAKASTQTKSRLVTKEEFAGKGGMSARASSLAYDAGRMTLTENGYAEGAVSVDFFDALNYSTPAAGASAVQQAIAKAANSLLGAFGSAELRQQLEDFKTIDPDAKFVDLFRQRISA